MSLALFWCWEIRREVDQVPVPHGVCRKQRGSLPSLVSPRTDWDFIHSLRRVKIPRELLTLCLFLYFFARFTVSVECLLFAGLCTCERSLQKWWSLAAELQEQLGRYHNQGLAGGGRVCLLKGGGAQPGQKTGQGRRG